MDSLDGIWHLTDAHARDEAGNLLAAPYGARPMGQITFSDGRVLAAIWQGDAGPDPSGGYNSYGGRYTFDGATLRTTVDVASDPARAGGVQERAVEVDGDRMVLKTPLQRYGGQMQQREFVWTRVWRPA